MCNKMGKKKKTNLKKILIPILTLLVILFVATALNARVEDKSLPTATKPSRLAVVSDEEPFPGILNLPVPFTPEAPDGLMVKPWNNSCEEASLVMLDEYYSGKRYLTTPKTTAKKLILEYIAIENRIFGYNANTNAKEMTKLANEYSKYFEAQVVTSPTLEQIKAELRAERPVIALVYGFELNNPRILFSLTGSYYHTFVIKGYDDETQEFIVNDNGDLKQGLDLRYTYDTILGALRDYNHKTQKTEKPATALFTNQRMLVKTLGSGKVYLIKDNQKHYITSPQVFKDNAWKWSLVTTVDKAWLDKFSTGHSL